MQTCNSNGIVRKVLPSFIGAPDWILEIVSPSSVKKDKQVLLENYFTAGIPEYWLVDALEEETEFTILISGNTEYVSAPISEDGWAQSPLFGRWFKLTRARDQVGLWEYTLTTRE